MGIVFQLLNCGCGWTNTNDSRHVVRIHGFLLAELLNSLSLPLQADSNWPVRHRCQSGTDTHTYQYNATDVASCEMESAAAFGKGIKSSTQKSVNRISQESHNDERAAQEKNLEPGWADARGNKLRK